MQAPPFLNRPPALVLRPLGLLPTVDLDFQNGRYWQDGVSGRTAADLVTTSRASTGYGQMVTGNLVLFGTNVPRITDRGLLCEEARSNLLLQSSALTNAAWTANATTVTGGQTDPAGGTTAAKLVPSSSNVKHSLANTTGLTLTAAVYTASVWMKPAGYNFGTVIIVSPTGTTRFGATFDLVNGGAATKTQSAGSPTSTSSSVTVYPNGWALCQVSMTAVATATASFAVFGPASTGTPTMDATTLEPTFAGDSTSGVLAFTPQLELGAFVTSPIPTTSGSATRAADVVTLTNVPAFGSAYTIFAKGTPNVSGATIVQTALSVDDGSNNNRAQINLTTAGKQTFNVVLAGATGLNGPASVAWSSSGKAALAATPGDIAGSFNGAAVTTTASANVPTLTKVHIGSGSTGANLFDGYIERIALDATRRWSNTALQEVTI